MSYSLWPYGLQRTRLSCPSLSPRVCSNSCPLSQWCYLTMSLDSSNFWLLASGSQSTGALDSAPTIPINIQGWYHYEFDLIVQGTLKSLLQHHNSKASIICHLAILMAQLSYPYMPFRKAIALTICTVVWKEMSLLFNMLSRFVIDFLPRSKSLLILSLQSASTVILEPKKINLSLLPLFPLLFAMKWCDKNAMILAFWMLSFKPVFSMINFFN